jgi:hypothetical protein
MTKQLTLISLPAPDAPPAPDPGAAPTPTPRPATRRRTRTDVTPRRSAGHPGWLDHRTIETGKQGLAAARAALAEATRRAHERDEQREARRIQDLVLQADVIRHPATRARRAA